MVRLAPTTGPVKNATEALAYLEQCSLIEVNNNYDLKMLANLLVTTSLDPKVLDQATNVITAVALLMLNRIQNKFADEITAAVVAKLHTPTSNLLNQLKHENEFLAAASTDQASHAQCLHELTSSLNTSTQQLASTITNLNDKFTDLLLLFTTAANKIEVAAE